MTDTAALAKERELIFRNLFDGKIPSRVPIGGGMGFDAGIEYCGLNVAEVYWDFTKAEQVLETICEEFPTDSAPGPGRRYAGYYQLLGARPFVMSSTGHMQHPNVVGMLPEDYDDFIANPYDTIIEKILPRLYTELDTDPYTRSLVLAKAMRSRDEDMATIAAISARIRKKYGYPSMAGGSTTAPFDFLADFFRSFTGILSDIRRYPDKVIAACEAILPILIKKGKPAAPSTFGQTGIPLHMGPYMKEKDFAKFYWPTLKAQVEALAAMGHNVNLFVEHDYMRLLDYLAELPENTILRFEYGDPQLVKDKLGKKFIIGGFYPLMLLHTGTKEQCLDKAKELLDILAPGGRYWFSFDKGAFDTHGNLVENLKAVLEYVRENGKYDNPDDPGENKKERVWRGDEIVAEIEKNLNSKYYKTWEEYKAEHPELEGRPEHVIAAKIKRYEDYMFNFIINLCS